MPFIAKVLGRPLAKISASYCFKKASIAMTASGSVQHSASACSFATRRRLRFPSPLLVAALDFGSALQILVVASQIELFLISKRHELCRRIAVEVLS
jgi:hypothetical protein